MSKRRGAIAAFHPDPPPLRPPKGPEVRKDGLFSSLSGIFNQQRISKEEAVSENKSLPSPRSKPHVDLDIDKAMSYVLAHKNFSSVLLFLGRDPLEVIDEPLGDLKTVDSLEVLGISPEKSESLWRLEVERLVTGINNADLSPLFPDSSIPDGDYYLLMSLAKEIEFLLSIGQVFNVTASMEEIPSVNREDQLEQVCFHLRHEKLSIDSKKAKKNPESFTGMKPTLSKQQRRKSVFALIDFITLVLGRILVYSAPHDPLWCYTCLSSLAKYTTKLKVFTKDPTGFAATALRNAEDATMFIRNSDDSQKNTRLGGAAGLFARLNQQNAGKTEADLAYAAYYRQNVATRDRLDSFITFVNNGLLGAASAGTPLTTFEICSVVYETGLERFRTWVYQEREGDLQATSCQNIIPMARPAFQLLQETARALQADQKLRSRPPPTTASNPSIKDETRQPLNTHLQWNDISSDSVGCSAITDGCSPAHSIEIRTLAEAITIMVPLLFVSPRVLSYMPDLFRTVTKFGERFGQSPVLPPRPGKFKAFFSLTGGQFDLGKLRGPLSASSLSRGLMNRDRLLLGTKISESHGQSFPQAIDSEARRREVVLAMAMAMDCKNREMEKWIFEETAVLVSCKFYVWTTMAFATLLAVCGVVVGFTVRGRVEAVDPFNITTYCWVLAAFGILVAKSIRVETWPWRDFLHGYVRCRSVTELYSVTRIPEEFILCKLLDAEETSILDTRGPYNAAFERRYDAGFSIDRPLSMWTMLLSGLIMIIVDTDRGPSLVCLDVRRGTEYVSVSHSGGKNVRGQEKERIFCTNLTRSDDKLPLKRQIVEWNRVVGLYNNEDAEFV